MPIPNLTAKVALIIGAAGNFGRRYRFPKGDPSD